MISALQTRAGVHRLWLTTLVLTGAIACGGGGGSSATRSPTVVPSTSESPRSPAPSSSSPHPTIAPVPVESNPPGDIPDNLAFVRYRNSVGHYSFVHPEGWAETGSAAAVNFTDKLNGVSVNATAATSPPTVASARSIEIPRLQKSVPAFRLRKITGISLPAGRGVRIVFRRNSKPDDVTGKVYRDEVEEYLVFSSGRLVQMDLYGPVGADNIDAYRQMSRSLRIR